MVISSPVGTARTEKKLRKPWADENALKEAVRAECKRRYEERFGVAWDPDIGTRLRDEYNRWTNLNSAAQKALEQLAAAERTAKAALGDHGLLGKSATTAGLGTTPKMFELMAWYEDHGGKLPPAEWADGLLTPSLRTFILHHWGEVALDLLPFSKDWPADGPYKPVGLAGREKVVLENIDIAVVCLLCDEWPGSFKLQVSEGATPAEVIDTMRRSVKEARRQSPNPGRSAVPASVPSAPTPTPSKVDAHTLVELVRAVAETAARTGEGWDDVEKVALAAVDTAMALADVARAKAELATDSAVVADQVLAVAEKVAAMVAEKAAAARVEKAALRPTTGEGNS